MIYHTWIPLVKHEEYLKSQDFTTTNSQNKCPLDVRLPRLQLTYFQLVRENKHHMVYSDCSHMISYFHPDISYWIPREREREWERETQNHQNVPKNLTRPMTTKNGFCSMMFRVVGKNHGGSANLSQQSQHCQPSPVLESIFHHVDRLDWTVRICRFATRWVWEYLTRWGGSNIFHLCPLFGEDFQFDYYFSDGLVQPPSSYRSISLIDVAMFHHVSPIM